MHTALRRELRYWLREQWWWLGLLLAVVGELILCWDEGVQGVN